MQTRRGWQPQQKLQKTLVYILFVPCFSFLSVLLLNLTTRGDQISYSRLYGAYKNAPIHKILEVGRQVVGSSEPLSLFLIWIGAVLSIDKHIYISIWNFVLISGICHLGNLHKLRPITIFLLLTNFYLFVLITTTERLKFAYIIGIWAIIYRGKLGLTLAAISPLAHFQSLLFLPGLVASQRLLQTFRALSRGIIKSKDFIAGCTITSAAAFTFYYFSDTLLHKATSYYNQMPPNSDLVNLAILTSIATIVTRRKINMLMMLLPMFVLAVFLGANRINMIAFSLVFYALLQEQKCEHPLILFLLTYFSVKSIPFILNIILFGDGFYNHSYLF